VVCVGEGIEWEEVLDLLAQLVDKSLVLVAVHQGGEQEEVRYRLLETVRQYGKERLEESGEAEPVRERHARYYLRLAEEAEPESREQGAWLERLDTEQANFRATLGWALDPEAAQEPTGGRAGLGLRLAAALAQGRFWAAYGPSEGLGWLERALAGTSSSTSSQPARAKALNEAGYILTWRGEYERGVALLEESLALFKELGDESGIAASFFQLALTVLHRGDHERVGALREQAEVLRRELSDRRAISHLLHFLAMASLDEYDYERAVALFEESLVLFREQGDLRSTAMCLTGLGMTALEREDHERAAVIFEEDLRVLLELRDKVAIVYGLLGVAGVASQRGGAARAARLWGAAEALEEANSFSMSPFVRAHYDYEGYLAAARSQLDEEAWGAAWLEGKAMAPEQAIEYALDPSPATTRPRPENIATLSAREVEVLTLVAEGLTDSQVAERLYLSPRTVGQHLRSIYNKLGASSRTAAVKEAVGRGLI
jgi:DNA-binding CsgD family transcriptional regulator